MSDAIQFAKHLRKRAAKRPNDVVGEEACHVGRHGALTRTGFGDACRLAPFKEVNQRLRRQSVVSTACKKRRTLHGPLKIDSGEGSVWSADRVVIRANWHENSRVSERFGSTRIAHSVGR